ncbi:riboflavin synthase subunit alpha [Tersicoccus phoenicis]|uniref:Riboflavin synthase n=1 Tax=Tersicoccus phoenicis TaxID=554083 RepID=A0A1R1LPF1_9MICC|nr:riboflavin synthase [Tersicoccus phoenicis]OMH29374.1 riboflavin synthase subunit alpha [Tersicoccus phoenicis]
MFTGIITDRGMVRDLVVDPARDSAVLTLTAHDATTDLPIGGSLAVNGVCLTATAPEQTSAAAAPEPTGTGSAGSVVTGTVRLDVMGETLRRTTIGALTPGDTVNLERCLQPTGRLDGHIVQGHVDGVARLTEREHLGDWERLRFTVPATLAPYLAEKGSVAVEGVSLTVTAVSPATVDEHWFEVGLIPTTLAVTTLGARQPGDAVNLEVDVMAKYAARLAAFGAVPTRGAAGLAGADRTGTAVPDEGVRA